MKAKEWIAQLEAEVAEATREERFFACATSGFGQHHLARFVPE
jgi:hypothetical protein